MVKEVKIKVVGHRMIPFGELTNATGSANTPKLRLYFNSEWDGMSKTAKFTDARGNDAETTDIVDMTLQEDYSYLLEVPASVLQYEGDAQLTIVGTVVDGTSATTRITTIPLAFSVQDSGSWRVAWNNEQPEATVAEQVLAIVHDAEAYARGTVDGVPVPERARDNAKYYKEQAGRYKDGTASDAAAAEAYAIGTVDGEPVPVDNSAKHWAEEAASYASAAEDAQTAAEGAAATAGNQAAAALGYRNEAQTFASSASGFAATAEAGKSAAETAQGLAETAQSKAEAAQSAAEGSRTIASQAAIDADGARYDAVVAQGKAEDAQTAAAASASDALASSQTAQAWAEGKREDADVPSTDPAYHNNAKYWSEQAAQTLSSKYEKPANGIPTADLADGAVTIEKLADDVNERICSAYPSETQSGESILHTDIGADGVPVKAFNLIATSGSGIATVKRCGKNLFERTAITFTRKQHIDANGNVITTGPLANTYACSVFIPVLPNTDYVFSGVIASSVVVQGVYTYAYEYTEDNMSAYVVRTRCDNNAILHFTTGANTKFIILIVPDSIITTGNIIYDAKTPQLEYGTSATEYQEYSGSEYEVSVDGAGTYAVAPTPTTTLGENTFYIVPGSGVTATLDATLRLDPTLAYDKLKAAIVAAGTN